MAGQNREKLRPIMFVGTGSDVGKSIINAAVCRILKQDGYRPAPFKAQNMSLNSYATPDGLEIGRAQAVQAGACGLACEVEMNPVLLKPTGNMQSQVVLHGKPVGNQSAKEYFLGNNKMELFKEVVGAYKRLEQKYNPIVLEGAGSISELNLKERDITNMRMAKEVGAATYLVADIDRGGVFASVYGSVKLLPPEEQSLIKGVIINKFRGDARLFDDGKRILEQLTGVPVVGLVPYFNDIYIEEEDSVSLSKKNKSALSGKVNIAVVLLRHISNFTDFDHFQFIDGVHLYFSNSPAEIAKADIILIPGSKNTISDMEFIQEMGLKEVILSKWKQGCPVYGVCGGYQIMGVEIADPHLVEGGVGAIEGLGILPVKTILTKEKRSVQSPFYFMGGDKVCHGYEIHMGQTGPLAQPSPLCELQNGQVDGYFLNPSVWGSYIHGIFDNEEVLRGILTPFGISGQVHDHHAFKEAQFDKLADFARQHIDMQAIYQVLKL